MSRRLFRRALGPLVIVAAWTAAARLVGAPILPSPLAVAENLLQIFSSHILVHACYSLWRILAGLLLAAAAAAPVAVCMGYDRRWNRILSPLVYLAYPVPKIALLPILMLVFGLGELSKILMIFLIVVFQVIVAARDGIRSIPKEAYYPLYCLGARFWDIFREVILPAALPKFLTALRVAMATAISVLFFTETFGTQYGMGYFIMDAWMRVNYLEMYSGIVVLSVMGLLLFGAIDFLEKKLCRWQYK